MSATIQEAPEMQETQEEQPLQSNQAESNISTERAETDANSATELEVPQWSVVTFEGVAMSGLTYAEAQNWLNKLNEQKLSGLCIVTDEAAARMSK